MTTTILCGMPAEVNIAKQCFPKLNIIQFEHSSTYVLNDHVPKDCDHIVSFGLCGGLAPFLNVADIAIATSINGSALEVPVDFYRLLNIQYLTVKLCPWYSDGQENEANSVDQRATLYSKTGAWAIDDESYYAWKLAQERKIEFSIIRSVSDDAMMNLPPAATGPIMNADGSANTTYLEQSIKNDPSQIGTLIEVGWDFGRSLHALWQIGQRLTFTS